MTAITAACKMIDYVLHSSGVLKEDEIAPGVLSKPTSNGAKVNGNGHTNDGTRSLSEPIANSSVTRQSALDGPDLFWSLRGLGWKFGTGSHLYIPPEWRDTSSRSKWIFQTFQHTLLYFFWTDLLESTLKLFPGVGDAEGGSMFAFGRNAVEKRVISTGIEILTGFGIIVGK